MPRQRPPIASTQATVKEYTDLGVPLGWTAERIDAADSTGREITDRGYVDRPLEEARSDEARIGAAEPTGREITDRDYADRPVEEARINEARIGAAGTQRSPAAP